MTEPKLIVFDLDNTLYDWVAYFVPSFYSMIDEVTRITGWHREELLDDFREVHTKFHDSEYPFALFETKHVKAHFGNCTRRELAIRFDSALHKFNSSRKKHLHLYEGVADTLAQLRGHNFIIAAHTESNLFAALDRLNRLNIIHFFNYIYCRERPSTQHPNDIPRNNYDTASLAKVRELAHHERKPNRSVLLDICLDAQISPSHSFYMGDSISKDISMANAANVFSIWAAYGAKHDPALYPALVRISHWTPEDIEREKRLSQEARHVHPRLVAKETIKEIIPAILQ